jgi:hypothetical protein
MSYSLGGFPHSLSSSSIPAVHSSAPMAATSSATAADGHGAVGVLSSLQEKDDEIKAWTARKAQITARFQQLQALSSQISGELDAAWESKARAMQSRAGLSSHFQEAKRERDRLANEIDKKSALLSKCRTEEERLSQAIRKEQQRYVDSMTALCFELSSLIPADNADVGSKEKKMLQLSGLLAENEKLRERVYDLRSREEQERENILVRLNLSDSGGSMSSSQEANGGHSQNVREAAVGVPEWMSANNSAMQGNPTNYRTHLRHSSLHDEGGQMEIDDSAR